MKRTVLLVVLASVVATEVVVAGLESGVASAATPKLATTTSVSCSPSSVVETNTTACSVTVSAGDHAAPTGSVSVSGSNGTVSRKGCALNSGTCTVTYAPNGSGSRTRKDTIRASYAGSSGDAASSGSTLVPVTQRAPAGVSLSCDGAGGFGAAPGVAVEDNQALCLVAVSGTALAPTGTVTMKGTDGTVTPAACTLTSINGAQACLLVYSPAGSGTSTRKDTLTASYSGDHRFRPATGTAKVAVIPRAVGSVSLSCDGIGGIGAGPAIAVEAHSALCTATVTGKPDGFAPSGTVTVKGNLGTTSPGSSCRLVATENQAQCSLFYLPSGSGAASRRDTLTVSYGGDNYYRPGSSTTKLAVIARPTPKVTVSCAGVGLLGAGPGVAVEENSAVCTGTVTGTSSEFTPSGTITMTGSHGSMTPASCTPTFTDGQMQCVLLYVPSGAGSTSREDTISVGYGGDLSYRAAKATATLKVIARAVPTLAVTCSGIGGFGSRTGVTVEGHSALCTASVTGASILRPSGSVTMKGSDGTMSPTSCAIQGVPSPPVTAQCSEFYVPSGVGSATRQDTITVSYGGDTNYQATTATAKLKVITRAVSSLAVSCDAVSGQVAPTGSVVAGGTAECTATVLGNADDFAPSGTVSFSGSDGSMSPTTCTIDDAGTSAGDAVCSVSYTPAGAGSTSRQDTITASYGGDAFYRPATGTTKLPVMRQTPITGVFCGYEPGVGIAVTCTANVEAPVPSGEAPTGTVRFVVNGGSANGTFAPVSCTLKAGSEGESSCSVQYTSKGAEPVDTITADYVGNSQYAPAIDFTEFNTGS